MTLSQRNILTLQEDQSLISPHKIEPYIVRISQSIDLLIRVYRSKKTELSLVISRCVTSLLRVKLNCRT